MAQHLEKTLSYEGITSKHFLSLAREVIKKLNWTEDSVSSTGIAAHTTTSGVSWGEVIKITASNSIATINSECMSPGQIIDWGKNRRNINKFISTYNEIKELYYGEQLKTMLSDFEEECSKASSSPVNNTTETQASPIPKLTDVLTFNKKYIVTPTIIAINVLVFILMVFSGVSFIQPSTLDILNWGGNFRPYTTNGQWWRLISNVFVHIGIIHIAFNMYALLYIGALLEPYLGKLRFAVAYILTGIAASVASLWWHDNIVSAGASGAIFGMYGVFLALLTTKNIIDKSVRTNLLTSIVCFIAYNLFSGLTGSGVDNAAHIGGLISGLIIGYAYLPSLKKNDDKKLINATSLALTVAVVAVSFFVCSQLPESPLYKKLNENETKTPAQEFYNEKFKWRITIPENFIAIDNEKRQEITEKAKETIQDTYGEDVEIDTESTKNIFAFQNGIGNNVEANYGTYDSAYYKNYDENCNNIMQAMYDMLMNSFEEHHVKIDTISSIETIDGLQFHKLMLIMNGEGTKLNMIVFLRLFGNEEFGITITYINKKKGEQMIDAFRNSTFGK